MDEGRYIAGVTVIAAPVRPRQRVSHALIIVGVSEQLRRIGLEAIGARLREEAGALTQQLEAG